MLELVQVPPLIGALFLIYIVFLILTKQKRTKLNIVFLFFVICVAVWHLGTFGMLLDVNSTSVLWWDKLVYVSVIFMLATSYHFTIIFIENNSRISIYLTYLLLSIFAILVVFTDLIINDIFVYQWGVHSEAQILHGYFLIVFILYSIYIYKLLFKFYKTTKDHNKKIQTVYILVAFLFLEVFGIIGFLPAYKIEVYPVSYLAGLVFVIIVFYAMTKSSFLKTRLFLVYLLIVIINILTVSFLIMSKSISDLILRSAFFIIIVIINIIIQKSFKKEIQQKEELQQLAFDLDQANQRLIELDKAKNEFMSVATHQLRTPTTAVNGYTSMILEGDFGKSDPAVIASIKKIRKANERMMQLIEDLLNTSRIESGHLTYDFEEANLNLILGELNDTFILRAKEEGLDFSIVYNDGDLPNVWADYKKIREVISNLIDNAIKYTEKGSVKVIAEKNAGFVKITVQDTGRGMSEKTMENLFHKFTRGQESASDVEGTGLGLFVVKNLVERHAGKIKAYSGGLDRGSKFVLKLPIKTKNVIVQDGRVVMLEEAQKQADPAIVFDDE
jgi:signal transduction histidine kinase